MVEGGGTLEVDFGRRIDRLGFGYYFCEWSGEW